MAHRISHSGLSRAGAALALLGAFALGGCGEEGQGGFNLFQPRAETEDGTGAAAEGTTRLVERDVEAPEVFQVTEAGLWDGRPSLGGVWVAHPDVGEPERVIIRNTDNSKFVIGALFRRERENPGPPIQVSSDAADALGMLAGAPAQLNVTALRREAQPEEEPVPAPTADLAAPEDVETTALDPVATAAGAAIDAAETAPPAQQPAAAPPAAAQPAATPAQGSSLDKPYIQIGIFSVEENARNTATAMRQNGMVPIVKKQSAKGKTFWRVLVGPAAERSERSVLLRKIRGVGFADAYPVTD